MDAPHSLRKGRPTSSVTRSSAPTWLSRALGLDCAGLSAVWIVYAAAANLFLNLGGVQRLLKGQNTVELTFDAAFTYWPGEVHVRGYRMIFQDPSRRVVARAAARRDRRRSSSAVRAPLPGPQRTRIARGISIAASSRSGRRRAPEHRSAAAYPRVRSGPVQSRDGPQNRPSATRIIASGACDSTRSISSSRSSGSNRCGTWAPRAYAAVSSCVRSGLSWVGPATLELGGGRVLVSDTVLASALSGTIACTMPRFDVREREGRSILRHVPGQDSAARQRRSRRARDDLLAPGYELAIASEPG